MKRQNRTLKEMLTSGNLIDPTELALALRVSRPTVYSWVAKNLVPHIKFQNLVRFEPEAIQTWLKSRRQGPGTVVQCPYGDEGLTIGKDFRCAEECDSCPVSQACCELAAQRVVRQPFRVAG
jgi:excisionase family DNA binding protein